MKTFRDWTLAWIVAIVAPVFAATPGIAPAQSTHRPEAAAPSARAKFVGAWRLAWMEEPGPDGKLTRKTDRRGILIYTADGHMSVEIMYPKSEIKLSNAYVQGGYEASFGSYEVNEAAHTITHHVAGSVTRELIGKDLPRTYEFSDGRLVLKSSRPDEHWSVAWEHY